MNIISNRKSMKFIGALTILFFLQYSVVAQPTTGSDSTKTPKTIKAYKELITTSAQTQKGLIWIHKVSDSFYWEIKDSLLNKDILIVSRFSKAGTEMRVRGYGYGGDQINETVIRFEKGPSNKLFIRRVSFAEYSKDSTNTMFKAVMNSNLQPIAASFDIKAFNYSENSSVIDVGSFLNNDNEILFFDPIVKSFLKLGAFQADKSYIVNVKSYPTNTEIKTVKTYARAPQQIADLTIARGTTTVEINSSIVLLPTNPMKPRIYDDRVGYFATSYTDYDVDPQGVEAIYTIKRWRLEPKDEDIEKYKRGELVEPKKPIIFYIDPATPKKWVPYLIQGVNDWQIAFEKAGFKKAIYAREAPTKEEDSTWSLEDARFSAIVYKSSDIPNASGPSISDPRSGEILESHINWYHNVMKLIRDWYFVQCAAVDTRARKAEFDDALMGQLIQFVSSHEVGHTLGLRHNWGASSTVPVDSLRNKKWVEENGHTPSIMDYARFNYVAQPEDNISEKGLFPRIGDYDKWAIEWGYKWLSQLKDEKEEIAYLNKLTTQKLKNPRLWFGSELQFDDPRTQNEDLGDNAVKSGLYGIKNLNRIVKNLLEWYKEDSISDYKGLRHIYHQIVVQLSLYAGHVSNIIGGQYKTPKKTDQNGPIYENVPAARQKEALKFLNENIFTTPTWILNEPLFVKTGDKSTQIILSIQNAVITRILHPYTLEKLVTANSESNQSIYSLETYLSDIKHNIWSELTNKSSIDIYRRNLQKLYVEKFKSLITGSKDFPELLIPPPGFTVGGATILLKTSDAYSIIIDHLKALNNEIKAAVPFEKDKMTIYHLKDVSERIDDIFKKTK